MWPWIGGAAALIMLGLVVWATAWIAWPASVVLIVVGIMHGSGKGIVPKRPRDLNALAKSIVDEATGDAEPATDPAPDPADHRVLEEG